MVIKLSKKKNIFLFHSVSLLDIALAVKHMAIMLKSGLGFDEILDGLSKQTTDEKLKIVFQEIREDIAAGKSLAESMKKHPDVFSDIIISVVDVGEQGATLEKNLIFLADYLEKKYAIQKKIKGAMAYPMVILVLTLVEILSVVFFVLPQLESLFVGFEGIPKMTLIILSVAKNIRMHWPIILGVIIVIFIIFKLIMRTKAGIKLKDRLTLVFPIFGKLTRFNTLSNLSRTLGILLESGIPLQNAMEITQSTTGNYVYANIIGKVIESMKSGSNVSESLGKYEQYFPYTFVKLLEVGEQTGSLEDNLEYLYEFYSHEVEDITNNLATLLEPLLLIFIGLMIGLLAITIIGPIYELTGTINNV